MLTINDTCQLLRSQIGSKHRADLDLDANTRLEDLGLSSLQIAEVIFGLEERLGIEFDPVTASEVATIGELVEMANGLVSAPVEH
jgi:acyl carrier protein